MKRLVVRSGISLFASLTLLALSGSSIAAEPDDMAEARPETWDMTQQELQEIGLGQSRGEPRPVPDHYPRLNLTQPPSEGGNPPPKIIFVNFDGAMLTMGSDDAKNNVTQIGELAGTFAPYGVGDKRTAVMQATRNDWAAYNMDVVDTRPASGEYTMNMTGPTNPFGGGVLGIAPLDCNDAQTHSNITYAFHSANDNFSAAIQATTVSQEVAHSYGLEHVDEPGDIMNPFNAGGDASFIDSCIPIVTNGQGIACVQQHAAHCSGGTAQNAHLELLDLFGAAVPDTAAPVVAITSPSDGDVFEPGSSFEILVTASDDVSVQEVELFNNGTPVQTDASEPYGWEVDNIPEGDYELFVIARDAAGNETTSESVNIVVGTAPSGGSDSAGGSGSDSGDDDGDPDGGDGADGDTDGGTDGLPMGFGDGDAETGCGCTQGAPEPAWLLLFGLFGLTRRRRVR